MTTQRSDRPAATATADRYLVMDVLRGFALLGVLLMNLYGYGVEILMTDKQASTLSTAWLDRPVEFVLEWLAYDKANTLFAFLFGLGFWVQLERLEARGVPFRRIYLRRILILSAIGWLHLLFLFSWDILHIYGLAAVLLLVCRGLRDRTLFWLALSLLLIGRPLVNWLFEFSGVSELFEGVGESDVGVLALQEIARSGDFWTFISWMNSDNLAWMLGGGLSGWFAYALGRFLMGAWVARRGWIQRADTHRSVFKRALWPLLLSGLSLELAHLLTSELSRWALAGQIGGIRTLMHALATPLIAAGYVCALVLLFQSHWGRRLLMPLAPVGQMALSNYLTQSVAILLILTAVGPGLGLAGQVGAATLSLLALAVFALQVLFSYLWMKAFAFGPAEWLWRALTYFSLPAIRRSRKS